MENDVVQSLQQVSTVESQFRSLGFWSKPMLSAAKKKKRKKILIKKHFLACYWVLVETKMLDHKTLSDRVSDNELGPLGPTKS